jgi:hypothetical protein
LGVRCYIKRDSNENNGPTYFGLDKKTFLEFLEVGKRKYNEQNDK